MPEAEEEGEGLDDQDGDDYGYAPAYNFEEVDYTVKPDFVDTVRGRSLSSKAKAVAVGVVVEAAGSLPGSES